MSQSPVPAGAGVSPSFHSSSAQSNSPSHDARVRVAVDVGGTFTDLVLLQSEKKFTAKLLTTPQAPEQAVLQGIEELLKQTYLPWEAVDSLILGTTLATTYAIDQLVPKLESVLK